MQFALPLHVLACCYCIVLGYVLVLVSSASAQTLDYFPTRIPDYCSKNVQGSRKIDELSASDRNKVAELLQVQGVIRHGARTPWTAETCWINYNVSWSSCNVTEIMLTSRTPYGDPFSAGSQTQTGNFMFRKLYDGFKDLLGGDCLTGQLLSEGFDQERDLGKVFADSYLDNINSNSDSNLNLFAAKAWDDINLREVYLRSDDEARTLMSGQIVFSSMFEKLLSPEGSSDTPVVGKSTTRVVDWHTGDYAIDQIHPNRVSCPRLYSLSADSFSSPQWIQYNTSKDIKELNAYLDGFFGNGFWSWSTVMDCLYTTVCSGRSVSYSSIASQNIVTPHFDDSIFNRVIKHVEAEYFYNSYFNDAIYSKVAMSNLAAKIKSYIKNVIESSTSSSSDSKKNSPRPIKFALWAGHDTTIMPFLASLSPQEVRDINKGGLDFSKIREKTWPEYASFVSIEVYKLKRENTDVDPKFAFRLIYNGRPLRLPGCPALADTSLCDVDILLESLAFSGDSAAFSCGKNVKKDREETQQGDDDVLAHRSKAKDSGCTMPIEQSAVDDLRSINTTSVLVALVLSIFIGSLIGATFVVYSYKNMISKGEIVITRCTDNNSEIVFNSKRPYTALDSGDDDSFEMEMVHPQRSDL